MSSTDALRGCDIDQPRRVSGLRLIVLCGLSLGVGITATVWLENRAIESYSATLYSKSTSVISQRTSRLQTIKVTIGQQIAPGDVLLQLSDDLLASQIVDKQRALVEMDAELKRVKATADVELEWRQRELNSEIFQTQLKLTAVNQERIARQVEQLAWQDHLKSIQPERIGPDLVEAVLPVKSVIVDSPFPDERRLQALIREDAAAAAAEALAAQSALCEEQVERLRKLQKGLESQIRISTGVELTEAKIARVREEVAALEKAQESLTVTSKAYGVVGSIRNQPGDLVRAGEPIIELLDDERRHLIAYLPSSAATRIRSGSRMDLVFPGKQSRTGLVAMIPPQAIPADRSTGNGDSCVEVTIEPTGKLWPRVPVGTHVQVKVAE